MRTRFFGQYLLAKGLITAPQLLAAVEHQERNNSKLGEYAQERGWLTSFEVEQVNSLQASEDRLFGEAAIKLGLLSDDQVEQILAAQQDRHMQLGQALLQLAYLDEAQLSQAIASYESDEDKIVPEVVTIPEDLQNKELAFELFYLAHKLLLRAWDVRSKTDKLRIQEDIANLSDRNVRIRVSGTFETQIFLGVPHAVAERAARRYTGEEPPTNDAVESIVREFANVLARNLRSVSVERGYRVTISDAELIENRLSLPPGAKAAVVPYLTHLGQVLVGMLV